jgi:hypothetical protein
MEALHGADEAGVAAFYADYRERVLGPPVSHEVFLHFMGGFLHKRTPEEEAELEEEERVVTAERKEAWLDFCVRWKANFPDRPLIEAWPRWNLGAEEEDDPWWFIPKDRNPLGLRGNGEWTLESSLEWHREDQDDQDAE